MGGGMLGTNPNYIGLYLKAHKIKYTKYETLNKLSNSISKNNILIMSFWNNKYGKLNLKTYGAGLHTVAVKCISKNKYEAYNYYSKSKSIGKFDSLKSLLEDLTFICAYKIK